jgi:hypothetical protein
VTGINPLQWLDRQDEGEPAESPPDLAFNMAARRLRLLAAPPDDSSSDGDHLPPGVPVVLEYEYESGFYSPCWSSRGHAERAGVWKLQVMSLPDRRLAVLACSEGPLLWLHPDWHATTIAEFHFVSPQTLQGIVGSVWIVPV